jgi:hypothetical protein
MIFDQTTCSGEVQVGQSRVVIGTGRDQHVVDRLRQLSEERVEAGRIGSVEGGGATCVDVRGRTFETVRIAPDKDEVGALAAGASSGFETDAGTPADQKNSLAEQLRFAEG